ncbi:MAG: hypothetical protein ABL895_03590 [Cyclobacteriaceae bacterium]
MAMTSQEQIELRSYCAFLLKEYGFQFSPSDPVIPALYIIHREMQLNIQNNCALAEQVQDAASRISPQVFHFNVEGEAWRFQMGITLRWVLGGILILLLCVMANWFWSNTRDVRNARTIIESSGNMEELLKAVKKEKSGSYFIDFTLAKGDSVQHFKEFVKVDSKTVRVYLGKESQ